MTYKIISGLTIMKEKTENIVEGDIKNHIVSWILHPAMQELNSTTK